MNLKRKTLSQLQDMALGAGVTPEELEGASLKSDIIKLIEDKTATERSQMLETKKEVEVKKVEERAEKVLRTQEIKPLSTERMVSHKHQAVMTRNVKFNGKTYLVGDVIQDNTVANQFISLNYAK